VTSSGCDLNIRRGEIDREVVIKYFEGLFSTRLGQEYSSIWTNLVMENAMLAPLQLKQQIDRAFDADVVDIFFFDWEEEKINILLELVESFL
jgi:hypothetical protein